MDNFTDQNETKEKQTDLDSSVINRESPQQNTHQKPLSVILILSFLVGIIGGLYGSLDLAKRDIFQRWFGGSSSGGSVTQSIVLNEESTITDVVKKVGPAVVSIVVKKDVGQSRSLGFGPFGFFEQPQSNPEPNIQQVGAGTGFFVSSDGLILTNRHVVSEESAQYTVLTNDGKSYEAEVVSRDTANDLALIKIELTGAPFLEFADSSLIELGQHVIAIGNTLGEYQNTVTTGVISGIDRDIFAAGGGASEQLEGVIQTDAAINPGNSGGPLLNIAGQVVGINTAVDRQGQLVSFAIASNDAKAALDSYIKNGKIVRPFLGVRYVMVSPAISEAESLERDYGALLLPGSGNSSPAVLNNSPASQAGLKSGDIILEINGEKLTEQNTLAQALKRYQPGDKLRLKVFDAEEKNEIDVEITVGER